MASSPLFLARGAGVSSLGILTCGQKTFPGLTLQGVLWSVGLSLVLPAVP